MAKLPGSTRRMLVLSDRTASDWTALPLPARAARPWPATQFKDNMARASHTSSVSCSAKCWPQNSSSVAPSTRCCRYAKSPSGRGNRGRALEGQPRCMAGAFARFPVTTNLRAGWTSRSSSSWGNLKNIQSIQRPAADTELPRPTKA